jgi:hypothetical protein
MTDKERGQPASAPLTAARVHAVAGTLADAQVAAILKTGASEADLLEALTWFETAGELGRELHRSLAGKVAAIVDILSVDVPEPDED